VQGHLGEVVFVELPEAGTKVSQGGAFGNVESVKATSDVNSPISGEVVEVNAKLSETPGLVRVPYCTAKPILTQLVYYVILTNGFAMAL
jgi:glycine cleavage system H protein